MNWTKLATRISLVKNNCENIDQLYFIKPLTRSSKKGHSKISFKPLTESWKFVEIQSRLLNLE